MNENKHLFFVFVCCFAEAKAPVKKIQYLFKYANVVDLATTACHSNLTEEQTSSQDADTLISSTSVVVRLYSSALCSSFSKKSWEKKNTHTQGL